MNDGDDLHELVERIKRKGPEYLDLITASTADEFDQAFQPILARAVAQLEKNKKHFANLDEEGLTAVLAAALTIPGLTVTQETHSNGHVDITIEADHCTPIRTKLGEAKIYKGPAYHLSGLEQLMSRYTTGRETFGLLVTYVRKPNVRGLIAKLRQKMDENLPIDQTGPATDSPLQWSFTTNHAHSSGENLDVCHLGCNLFVDDANISR